jgi:hypothetical protein
VVEVPRAVVEELDIGRKIDRDAATVGGKIVTL